MRNDILFITGMFRSGTTLLARMLAAHPLCAIASDPFAKIFKEFRNEVILTDIGDPTLDRNAPLGDYYFFRDQRVIKQAIQDASFNKPIRSISIETIQQNVRRASHPYSPNMGPYWDQLQGNNFKELLKSGLDIITKVYGDKHTQVVGFKEVWATEFVPHFLNVFPQAKVINIIRDPRAVVASKLAQKEKYPITFLARQWRKLYTLNWLQSSSSFCHTDRVMTLKYEQLLDDPDTNIKCICEFLHLEPDSSMADPKRYKDGAGMPWYQNSSHGENTQKFNKESATKWRYSLSSNQINMIEFMCLPEMLACGYQPDSVRTDIDKAKLLYSNAEVSACELAKWIRPYVSLDDENQRKNMALEIARMDILESDEVVTEAAKSLLCLDSNFFDLSRKNMKGTRKGQSK